MKKEIISGILNSLISPITLWIIGLVIATSFWIKFKVFLLQSTSIQILPALLFLLVFLYLVYFFIKIKFLKKEEYFIPTRRTLHNGIELSNYDRQTKWNYKNNNKFYFIPLISHDYDSSYFITYCGPFCTKCDHFLQINELSSNPKYFCIDCIKKYKVSSELLGNYDEKLMSYFKEEYRKKNLKGLS